MCGTLSSRSREAAMTRRSSWPVEAGRCASGVFSGWNASGMSPGMPAGLVLQVAQPQQVVDALLDRLDVPVEHRRVGPDALAVALARDLEPALARDLVLADDVAHAPGEDLGAAARAGVHAGVAAARGSRRRAGGLPDLRDPVELDHRPRLQVHAGELRLQRPEQARVVLERPGRVQPADDVELGHRLAVALARLGDALVDRHLVAAGLVDLLRPRAERAVHPAEVRRVQVPVDVVEGEVAVARSRGRGWRGARGRGSRASRRARRRPRTTRRSPREDLFRRSARGPSRGRRREQLRHGMAGLVTGWKGSCDTGRRRRRTASMYR